MARTVRNRWIARIVAADLDGARPWWASEYVAGPSRRVLGEVGPLGEAVVGLVGARLAAALAQLHAGGVLHSLLRPSSVLVAADGPWLINFGVSRCVEATEVVMSGVAMDSPAFLSTEQALGAPPGPGSDVFSLASVLVYAATGDGPFGLAGNPLAVVRRVAGGRVELSRGQLRARRASHHRRRPALDPALTDLDDALRATGSPDGASVSAQPLVALGRELFLAVTATTGGRLARSRIYAITPP